MYVTGPAKTLHVSMQILVHFYVFKSHNFLMVACKSTKICTVFAERTNNITCKALKDWLNC